MQISIDPDHPAIRLVAENDKDRAWISKAMNAGSERLRIVGCGMSPGSQWLHMSIGIVSDDIFGDSNDPK